jgi:hypothetical protein
MAPSLDLALPHLFLELTLASLYPLYVPRRGKKEEERDKDGTFLAVLAEDGGGGLEPIPTRDHGYGFLSIFSTLYTVRLRQNWSKSNGSPGLECRMWLPPTGDLNSPVQSGLFSVTSSTFYNTRQPRTTCRATAWWKDSTAN